MPHSSRSYDLLLRYWTTRICGTANMSTNKLGEHGEHILLHRSSLDILIAPIYGPSCQWSLSVDIKISGVLVKDFVDFISDSFSRHSVFISSTTRLTCSLVSLSPWNQESRTTWIQYYVPMFIISNLFISKSAYNARSFLLW